MRAIWVGTAGFGGAVARYWLDGLVSRVTGGSFPWGTFVVNISGCFVVGLLGALLTERLLPHPALRSAVLVGFVGAYTTFSTLMYETIQLYRGGAALLAVVNVAASIAFGLTAAWLGTLVGGAI